MSAVGALAVYGLMWLGYVLDWAWLAAVDATALDLTYGFGATRPGWIHAWDVFCVVFGPTAFRVVAAILILVALIGRTLRTAVFLLVTVELSGLVTAVAKLAVQRPRPSSAFVEESYTSFPSGHALGVMTGVLALLVVFWPRMRPPTRFWAAMCGAVIVVAVGVGRVVLHVHHPSDVVAGWALGYAYFVICVMLLPPVRAADEIPAVPGSAH